MKIRTWLLIVGCLVGFAGSPSMAQRAPATPSAPSAEAVGLARELLQVMGSDKQFDAMIPLMSQNMAGLLKSQKPGDAKVIDEVFAAIGKRFLERKSELLELLAPLYAARFAVPELKEMVGFFKSPVGQRLAAEMPALSQDAMKVGMVWGQRIGKDLEQEVVRELQQRGVKL